MIRLVLECDNIVILIMTMNQGEFSKQLCWFRGENGSRCCGLMKGKETPSKTILNNGKIELQTCMALQIEFCIH